MRALVYAAKPHDFARLQRTLRSIKAAALETAVVWDEAAMLRELRGAQTPLWLVRAGSWQPHPAQFRAIPPSASGRPLIGLSSGAHQINPSIYLEPEPAHVVAERMQAGATLHDAVRRVKRTAAFRSVPLHDIEVRFDPALRMVQLVTTIQIGGAERVTLDLAEECNRLGIPTVVAALGEPTRRSFSRPRYFADLSETEFDPESRASAIERLCLEWGADAIHAHLIKASEAEAIRARGIPLAVTVHNMSASWPAGYADAQKSFADLMIGCAEAVSREIIGRMPNAPVRTVWNGISHRRASTMGRESSASAVTREAIGWDPSDFVLLAIANPRRQKRLERLPEIVIRLEERIAPRRVRLLLAGEPATGSEDGREATAKLELAIEEWHVQKALHWAGAIDDVAPLLAIADGFVSTSDIEGMSLAQLEALAAGLPVVATNVGGAAEIAARSDRVFLLQRDSDAEAFANVLARLCNAAPPRTPALPKAFTRERMAIRSQQLYRGMLVDVATLRAERRAVWLLTNNFSIGGAQTSARRLLCGLALRGHEVRAATIEEAPERQSPGRRALASAGVPVSAIAPSPNPEALVDALLDRLAADPPRAVLFWNLITPVKVLLAEALNTVPIFDVSPGEMYFTSLERFFAAVPPGLPVADARTYGQRLAGVAVKYPGESARAHEVLGVPVHVIPNGVPLPAIKEPRPGKRLVIATASRLSPDKRLDQLLEAVRLAHPRLPPYELRIAGGPDGGSAEHFKELRRLARGLPVQWLGHRDDLSELHSEADIFAMISERAGCPNASLEAMAAGLPMIATDHGGAAEQVVDQLNGRLVARGDVQAVADALVDLANDSAARARMGAASYERAKSVFSIDRMLDAYSRLLGLTN